MPVVLPPGFAQFVLQWSSSTFDSGGGATVLGFGQPLGPDPLDAGLFAEAMGITAVAELLPGMHQAITLEAVYWQTENTSGEWPVGESGGRTGDLAPPNTTTLVSYRTQAKGPRGRGRSYFPGFLNDGDINDSGGLDAGRRTSIQDFIDSFFETMEGPSVDHVILQRDEPGQQSPPISPPPKVISRLVSAKPATQRRRLRR